MIQLRGSRMFRPCPSLMIVILGGLLWRDATAADRRQSPREQVARFVERTLQLELSGQRLKELTVEADNPPGEFYSGFQWDRGAEPEWDLLFVTAGIKISSVEYRRNQPWEEFTAEAEVANRKGPGYLVRVKLKNLYHFSREGFESSAGAERLSFFVVWKKARWVITDRLHAPHLGVVAARDLLNTDPYKTEKLEALRRALKKEVRPKRPRR